VNVFDASLIATVIGAALRAATPVVYAGLGALVCERSGLLNLGLEGLMLVGACVAVWAQLALGSWLVSITLAAAAAGAMGLAHAFFCVRLKSNQVVTGLAFFFLGQGITAVLGAPLVGRSVPLDIAPPLAFLETIPVIGPIAARQDIMALGAFVVAGALSVFLFRTRPGIALRACGESARSAAAVGIPVTRVRLGAGLVGGALCGLGGAHLSLFYAQQWQENMVAGRGWIALVMVILGMWLPSRVLLGAYVFGGMVTLQLNLQVSGVDVPQYLLALLPFVVTLVLLVVAAWRLKRLPSWMPADIGNSSG
jgi:ABC-type uncharacterized transport system permease subunit